MWVSVKHRGGFINSIDAAFLETYLEDLLPSISPEVVWITEEGGAKGWDRSYLSRTFENSYQAERKGRQRIHLFNNLWSSEGFVWMCLYLYLQNQRVCNLGARQKGSLLPDQFDWIHTRQKISVWSQKQCGAVDVPVETEVCPATSINWMCLGSQRQQMKYLQPL